MNRSDILLLADILLIFVEVNAIAIIKLNAQNIRKNTIITQGIRDKLDNHF